MIPICPRPERPGSEPVAAPSLTSAPVLALLLALLLLSPLAVSPATAKELSVESILPQGVSYDPAIPSPAESLGFEAGERHLRHHELVVYLQVLAREAERVELVQQQGLTHEGRPLIYLVITSPSNHGRLEEIRRRHLERTEGTPGSAAQPDAGSEGGADHGGPVVVWLGYSIHGNEASGSNAAPWVAYHLAAARDKEVEALLEETVVLLDPSLNPDGMARFAQWVAMYHGRREVADPAHREHREAWPGGRTNHYWYDLNRDWLLLQHPESRARVATLQHWRPNVVADFHEMGSGSTYFFQPGVPSRRNPLTPDRNVELTRAIARHHAETLDRHGRLYFTEEIFDDFYYGKGSTYPDVQGAVGILFEQASARGHRRETPHGALDFSYAVSNQFLTSLSTLAGAREQRPELLAYQESFFRQAREEARAASHRAWIFGSERDPRRGWELVRVLLGHGIQVRELTRTVEADGHRFEPGSAWVVPLEQRQYRLVRSLFERVTDFGDTTFYDVSTWTLPLAFDLPVARLGGAAAMAAGEPVSAGDIPRGELRTAGMEEDGEATASPYAWAFEWSGTFAPRALGRLLDAGAVARVATRPFEAVTPDGVHAFGRGTIVLPRGLQTAEDGELLEVLEGAAAEDGVTVHALVSGLTPEGIDLGSPSLTPIRPPQPALVIGEGIDAYEAGEMWHLLDHRFGLRVSLVHRDDLSSLDDRRYTHLILVDGDYGWVDEGTVEGLRRWLREGGTVVGVKRGGAWVDRVVLELDPRPEPEEDLERPLRRPYGEYSQDRGAELLSGAIVAAELDLTHPLAFGFEDPRLPLFRDSTAVFGASEDPYENVALYTGEPLLSGYASERNLARLAGSGAVVVRSSGSGQVVRLADNPSFRGFWYGSQRLVLNALFFAPAVRPTSPPETWLD